jgi:hypothetical protein
MASGRLEEREPISPELVLVSPPDVARRAREELREPPFIGETVQGVRDRQPEPPSRVASPVPPRAGSPWRRMRIVVAGTAIAVAAAAVAYLVVARDDGGPVANPAAGSRPRAAPTVQAAAPQATAPSTATVPSTVLPQHPKGKRKTRSKPRATAKQSKPRRKVAPVAGFVPARTWTWPESKGAHAYVMEFLLKGHVVLQLLTARPRLVLPPTFRFRAGTYRWIVRRIPPPANRRPIVSSRFVLTPTAAARANR